MDVLKLSVKTSRDEHFILMMDPDDKVIELKRKVAKKLGVPTGQQTVWYNDMLLSDSRKLQEYNMLNNGTVKVKILESPTTHGAAQLPEPAAAAAASKTCEVEVSKSAIEQLSPEEHELVAQIQGQITDEQLAVLLKLRGTTALVDEKFSGAPYAAAVAGNLVSQTLPGAVQPDSGISASSSRCMV
jgi:hypothetical protein